VLVRFKTLDELFRFTNVHVSRCFARQRCLRDSENEHVDASARRSRPAYDDINALRPHAALFSGGSSRVYDVVVAAKTQHEAGPATGRCLAAPWICLMDGQKCWEAYYWRMRRTSLRLSSADEAIVDALGQHRGIPRRVDVLRFALRDAARRLGIDVDAFDIRGDAREWRHEGHSDAAIAQALKEHYGLDVAPEIIATWENDTNSS
jgi:hypothetical protein